MRVFVTGSSDARTVRGETLEQAADPESGAALIGSQRRNFVFVAVLLGMLLAALDQTVVGVFSRFARSPRLLISAD